MQRLFSMFPVGLPGVGLLCLRVAAALSLGMAMPLAQGRFPAMEWILEFFGFLLLIGFGTPIFALLGALAGLYALIVSGGAAWESQAGPVLVALALALLGPGAYSVDARLFGRRSVVITGHADTHDRDR